jgi:hypothetical protein
VADPFKKHRVIGIRHTLKEIKDAGLISKGVLYPADAVVELQKTKTKADNAKRHRKARKDVAIPALIKTIEKTYKLPAGSIRVVYPSGRRAGANATAGSVRSKWERDA